MIPLFPSFWKYESFHPLVLKVWALCSPCFESMRPFFSFFQSISPFFTFLWFNVLKVWALCFLSWYQTFKKFQPWFTFPSSTFYPGLPILSPISLEMTMWYWLRYKDMIGLIFVLMLGRRTGVRWRVQCCFKFQSINLSSFVCEPVFFSCSWSSRLNLVVIMQCLVR